MGRLSILTSGAKEHDRLTRAQAYSIEYLGKSHGILVLLVMSERGRYHKG